jgi:crossover junction endodeoxyribonuclease RusA
MNRTLLRLNWPPAVLSPNNRSHRMVKAKVTKSYRITCQWDAIVQGLKPMPEVATLPIEFVFHPPRAPGMMNVDNIVSSLKAALDGFADILKIDDSKFRIVWPREFAQPVTGGEVVALIGDPA